MARQALETAMSTRILLVDDEPHSREGLRDALAREGHRVETAPDGWQSIRKIKEGRFQVALINLDLAPYQGVPLTGWDLIRIFRLYDPELAVILMAADAWRAGRPRAEELGVAEVLEKPINLAELKRLVREAGVRRAVPALLPRALRPSPLRLGESPA
jgi:DNA-binding NtrC family response regulator